MYGRAHITDESGCSTRKKHDLIVASNSRMTMRAHILSQIANLVDLANPKIKYNRPLVVNTKNLFINQEPFATWGAGVLRQ